MRSQSEGRPPIFSILRNTDFRYLWYAGVLVELTRWMELFVLSWLVLQITDSAFQVGLVLVFIHLGHGYIDSYVGRFLFHLYLLCEASGPTLQDDGSVGPSHLDSGSDSGVGAATLAVRWSSVSQGSIGLTATQSHL